MRGGASIRSDLRAHREQQPAIIDKAQKGYFGIYRPVSQEYADELHSVLADTKPALDKYLSKKGKDGIEIQIPPDFGLTYVMCARVKRRIKSALLLGFTLGRATEQINTAVETRDDALTVYQDDLSWYSQNERTLAMNICGDHADTIKVENEEIEDILDDLGMRRVSMSADHITLFRVGRGSQRVALDHWQRRDMSKMVQGRIIEAQIGSIALDPINIGRGYRNPIEA